MEIVKKIRCFVGNQALTMNEQFIPSIFNYCDRWCEKCPFTNRCRTYAMSAEWEANNPDKKGDWAAQVADSFAQAMAMIREEAARNGIDLDNLPEYIPPEPSPELLARKATSTQLIQHYETIAQHWKDQHQSHIEAWTKGIQKRYEMGIPNTESEFYEVQEAYEIIIWYYYFIRAKVRRAYSYLENDWGIEEDYPIQNDMNGSAKIAIIAVERSIAAWEMMRKYFQDEEDTIIDIMLTLARIQQRILKEFPDTMKFIRPGFDEI